MSRIKTCEGCGEVFLAMRRTERFCSGRCRRRTSDARPEVMERKRAQKRARYHSDPEYRAHQINAAKASYRKRTNAQD